MALHNQPIPSLFNGVSQQPAQLRLPSQCEVMDNFYPSLAVGLMKRPPSVLRAKLSNEVDTNSYVTVINRDTAERYVLMIRSGTIQVFDAFTGEEKQVDCPNGTNYLESLNPRKSFSTVTVADHSFIVNRDITVRKDAAATAPVNANAGYVHFTYNGTGTKRKMTITIPGYASSSVRATYENSSYSDLTDLIETLRADLAYKLGLHGWTVTVPFDNIIKLQAPGGVNWSLVVTDTYGGSTMKAIKGSVQLFSDLPPALEDGYVCYVSSSPESQGRGYYVRYDSASKSYVECPKQGINTSFLASTMPHKLVRNADGTFTFTTFDWEPRKVGDDKSNPFPSFMDRTIADVFLYRNRLGFLSDENVCLSVSGDYFNFGAKAASIVSDADPLDLAVANTKVSMLRHAIPFNKSLLLFSDQTQFHLSGGDVLSPRTVRADPVTEFSSSPFCRPVGAGQELFFVTDRPGHSGVREYFVEQDAITNDAVDITAHVPAYIPAGVFKMASSTAEDCLFLLTENERNAIYGYKYFWGGDEKAQSAWFRFLFDKGDTIIGCDFVGSVAYVVFQRSSGIYLEEINLQAGEVDPGSVFNSLIDRKVELTGTYDPETNKTTWVLPWHGTVSMLAILGPAFGNRRGSSIPLTMESADTASAKGDWTLGACLIGTSYTARFKFSEQCVKDSQGTAIASAKIKIRRMLISYVDSGYFRAEVKPPARDTATYVFTGKLLGVEGVTLGTPALSSGTMRFPILADSRGVSIELVNDSPMPSTFQGAEWEGEVVMVAKR